MFMMKIYAAAIRILSDGRIQTDPLISHRIKLEQAVTEGFECLNGPRRQEALKILVAP